MSASSETCKACRFYTAIPPDRVAGAFSTIKPDEWGLCRRLPPTLILAMPPTGYDTFTSNSRQQYATVDDLARGSRFPLAHEGGWCGEYQEKPNA